MAQNSWYWTQIFGSGSGGGRDPICDGSSESSNSTNDGIDKIIAEYRLLSSSITKITLDKDVLEQLNSFNQSLENFKNATLTKSALVENSTKYDPAHSQNDNAFGDMDDSQMGPTINEHQKHGKDCKHKHGKKSKQKLN